MRNTLQAGLSHISAVNVTIATPFFTLDCWIAAGVHTLLQHALIAAQQQLLQYEQTQH
jgi:hypothetical protein